DKRGRGRFFVKIMDMQLHEHGRDAFKIDRYLFTRGHDLTFPVVAAPKTEAEFRFLTASVSAIDLKDAIFKFQARNVFDQRLGIEHGQVQISLIYFAHGGHDWVRFAAGTLDERKRVRTIGLQLKVFDAGRVIDFHQEDSPALFG